MAAAPGEAQPLPGRVVPRRTTAGDLLDLFLDLVRLPSPSCHERPVADFVTARIAAAGLEVHEDEAGRRIGSDTGNLLVRVSGTDGAMPIVLSAHLDTVAHDQPVEPFVEDGIIRSRGDTILGGDDKIAVAGLMALLADLAAQPPAGDVEVLLTVCEEVGLRGAFEFDVSRLGAEAGFVLDSSGPLGSVLVAAPGQKRLVAEFRGTAAHAGLEPERGQSAILGASRAVSTMKLGRIDEQTTANIGIIGGGVATNIVPERCELRGEARSLSPERLAEQVAHMIGTIHLAAAEAGVDVGVEITGDYEGFRLPVDSRPALIAGEALRGMGLTPRFGGAGGGSDANVLNARGLPCVNLSAGFESVHSPEEYLPVERLDELYRLVHALVAAAGTRPPEARRP
jgi:tripeptide aminopeptidase